MQKMNIWIQIFWIFLNFYHSKLLRTCWEQYEVALIMSVDGSKRRTFFSAQSAFLDWKSVVRVAMEFAPDSDTAHFF